MISINDVCLKRALTWFQNLKDNPSNKYLKSFLEKYQPYSTVISLYLWAAVDNDIIRTPFNYFIE